MKSLALAFICAWPLIAKAQPAPASDGAVAGALNESIGNFLMRKDNGEWNFISKTAPRKIALRRAAIDWARMTDSSRVQALAAAAAPGSKVEKRLILAMSRWMKGDRVGGPEQVAGFLNGALAEVEKLNQDDAAGIRIPDDKSVERARLLRARLKDAAPVFGVDRYSPNTDTGISGDKSLKVKFFVEPPALPAKPKGRRIEVPPPFSVHRVNFDVNAPEVGGGYPSQPSDNIRPPNAGVIPNDPDPNKTKLPNQL